MLALQSVAGFFLILAFAWVISEKRNAVPWRTVISATILQVVLFVLMFKFPWFKEVASTLSKALDGIQAATTQGAGFVFGYLGSGKFPAEVIKGEFPFIFATQVLTMAVVISALSSLLFYWGILPLLVRGFSWVLTRSIGVGGAVGVSTAANVFLGMVEAPLFIKPYLAKLSRGELFITMTCGMAGIAGTVMAVYGNMLKNVDGALAHIVIVSIVSAPAAIAISCLMVPPEGEPTAGDVTKENPAATAMDAITQGTADGIQLFINVCALLLVLIALIALANSLLAWIMTAFGFAPMTLQGIVGYIMAPVVWLIGIPWSEAPSAGALMGTKTVVNEFVAFLDLSNLPKGTLSDRSSLIMTYALCGFANFSSIGIIIGGMSTMCPERRAEITGLGYKCLLGGTLATLSCGALVGIFY